MPEEFNPGTPDLTRCDFSNPHQPSLAGEVSAEISRTVRRFGKVTLRFQSPDKLNRISTEPLPAAEIQAAGNTAMLHPRPAWEPLTPGQTGLSLGCSKQVSQPHLGLFHVPLSGMEPDHATS